MLRSKLKEWPFKEHIPFAFDASKKITGIVADEATVFKSAKAPFKLVFTVIVDEKTAAASNSTPPVNAGGSDGRGDRNSNSSSSTSTETVRSGGAPPFSVAHAVRLAMQVVYKAGDDLRQDQLVLQMVSLMNDMLRSSSYDLKLTPYHVLATSEETGMVQFIESVGINDAIRESKTISDYLLSKAPASHAESLNNFVLSCGV
jgi:hypothetical protein